MTAKHWKYWTETGGAMWLLDGILVLLALAFLGLLAWKALPYIPEAHCGQVVSWFGGRTKRVIYEGLNVIVPIIQWITLIDLRLVPRIIELSFFSKDNLEVKIRALLQLRVDPDVRNAEDDPRAPRAVKFLENDERTIMDGIAEAVRSAVGKVIGTVGAFVFKDKKAVVERYISCMLRLEKPPHVEPKTVKDDWVVILTASATADELVELDKITDPVAEIQNWLIRLKFYEVFSNEIGTLLREEKSVRKAKSELENRYGIEFESFDMGDVDFSDLTKRSMEKEKQAQADAAAAQKYTDKFGDLFTKFTGPGYKMTKEVARNSALRLLGLTEMKVQAFEGLKGAINVKIGS